MEFKEDQTAPISAQEINLLIKSRECTTSLKEQIVARLLGCLSEKRDAYNGIVSSMIYLIDSADEFLVSNLKNELIKYVTCNPIKFGGKMFLEKALFRLTRERPVFIANLFETIIETTPAWSINFNHEGQVLRIQIISLKAIRRAEQQTGSSLCKIPVEEIDQLCDKAMLSCDDAIKVDTMYLVLDTKNTTQVLTDRELEVFRKSFYDALSLQEPSLRQIFLAMTNKLIKRIKNGIRVVMRDKKLYSDEQRALIGKRYLGFLGWLVNFCFDSIYCNAYFGSFVLTISTLKLIIEHISFSDENLPIENLFTRRRCYDSVLSCLTDSFEENKTLALELLFLLPKNEEFSSEANRRCFERIAYQLVGSVNPAHSLTCQYVFRLLVGLTQQVTSESKNHILFQHLCKLTDLVEKGIDEAEQNFTLALKQNPVYPKLTCIRALLDQVDVDLLQSDRLGWTGLAKRIVEASIRACEVVSGVVCNLNPETIGHLPMDLKPLNIESLSESLNMSLTVSDNQRESITSQMLLISGWKTIKECSLSMAALCTGFWWPKERIRAKKEKFPGSKENPILDSSDIRRIIRFFDHYLRNLRHRGAFEQAYNGFKIVTKRVWYEPEFKSLLIVTLEEIMADFKNTGTVSDDHRVECLKAYVTRRSAGLPFIVQAILNAEHQHDSKTLRWVMDRLFEVLTSEDSQVYQRIHCLNILKALIKEHQLGEKVIPYIGKTFAITMESFKSDSFPIRNCASMLLKATVDRTFGVNRLRDDIHKRNKLSYERFFTECPELHSLMLRHLNDGVEDRNCFAAVHSVFIILSRLKPSLNPSEDFDSETIIKPFYDPCYKLALTCPDFKLRELAAKMAVQIGANSPIGEGLFPSAVKLLNIYVVDNCDSNKLHGTLLFIRTVVQDLESCQSKDAPADWLEALIQVLTVLLDQSNAATFCNSIKICALDIVESFSIVFPQTAATWSKLLYKCIKTYHLRFIQTTAALSDFPNFEGFLFRLLTVYLMIEDSSTCSGQERVEAALEIAVELVVRAPDNIFSDNLQACLIRFMRQSLTISSATAGDSYIEKLLNNLDIDSTAPHLTPFDVLKQKSENDLVREKWTNYCEKCAIGQVLLSKIFRSKKILNLSNYKEFDLEKEISEGLTHDMKFSSRFSNTPRSIELMALLNILPRAFLDEKLVLPWGSESVIDKLSYLTHFISSLPDCDIKCVSLLNAAKLFGSLMDQLSRERFPQTGFAIRALEYFTQVVEELTDGHHSYVLRATCGQALQDCIRVAVNSNCEQTKPSLLNLLSALIKLSQDEENEIRQSSFKVMFDLRKSGNELRSARVTPSRLDNLISFITEDLFDSQRKDDIAICLDLLMRIVFNHKTNYSVDSAEGREQLFDKTKLNSFADHVAIIQSALTCLRAFLGPKSGSSDSEKPTKVDINSLRFSQDFLNELYSIDAPVADDNTGDYSWRLKKSRQTRRDVADKQRNAARVNPYRGDNLSTMDKLLHSIVESLNYFSDGYWNMLTDTEYTYHELTLFRRVAFVRFVLECTDESSYNSNCKFLIKKLEQKLKDLVSKSCSTTMLCRCLDMLT